MATLASGQVLPDGQVAKRRMREQHADRRRSRIFVHVTLVACLLLQRFGVIVGGGAIFLSLPLFLAMLGLMLVPGYARIRPGQLALFALFVLVGLITTAIAINIPETRHQLSILSFFSLLAVYLCVLVAPSDRFNGSDTLDIFLLYARICAILGIIQYALQFAGVKLFSFMLSFPALKPVLIEPLFNYNPVMEYGSRLLRSNGFFLVEPSIFSQVLALAMAVEYFLKQQVRYLPLYAVAYLLSFSGTGLLALGVSIVILTIADRRYTTRIASFIIVLAVVSIALQFLLPDLSASLTRRGTEGGESGSSAYARYFAQFDFIAHYLGQTRSLIGFGPGAMERSQFFFKGSGNPALKVFIEYGFVGLALFILFLVKSWWRRDIAIIAIFSLVNFQLGGGNLQFSPLIVLTTLLCVWSSDPRRSLASQNAGTMRSVASVTR